MDSPKQHGLNQSQPNCSATMLMTMLLCEYQLSFVRTVIINATLISKQAMKILRPLICF